MNENEEERLRKAVKALLSLTNAKSIRKTAKEFEVDNTTLQRRLKGIGARKEAQENKQALSNYQEQL